MDDVRSARKFAPVSSPCDSMQVLAERLRKNTTLTSLDLSSNALGSEGGSSIAQVSSRSTGQRTRLDSFLSYLYFSTFAPLRLAHYLLAICQKLTWLLTVSDLQKVLFSFNSCYCSCDMIRWMAR